MSSDWCLIESDPAVFTELLEKIGVEGVSAEEVLTLDDAELQAYERVYGLILLHKWKAGSAVPPPGSVVTGADGATPVYFARQVVQNACATLALVNILCNYADELTLGEAMQHFVAFTGTLDAATRGQLVGEYAPLRTAHNSFAPPPTMMSDDDADAAGAEAYHYVAFIVRDGAVWMLDGLQSGPVRCDEAVVGDGEGGSGYKAAMLRVARTYVDAHAAHDTSGSGQGISFSLMAIVDDPVQTVTRALAAQRARHEQPTEALERQLAALHAARARGRAENARRRHNYYPMLVALLSALAEKQLLDGVVDDAKAAAKARSGGGGGGGGNNHSNNNADGSGGSGGGGGTEAQNKATS